MTQGSVGLCSICVDLNFGVTSVGTSVVGQIGQTTFYHRRKNVFLLFLFWSRFFTFLTFFIFQTFFILKKRWQS